MLAKNLFTPFSAVIDVMSLAINILCGSIDEPLYEIKSMNNGGSVSSNNPPYFGVDLIPFFINSPSTLKLHIVAIPIFSSSFG